MSILLNVLTCLGWAWAAVFLLTAALAAACALNDLLRRHHQ